MTDEYRVITTKSNRGNYSTEIILNGERFSGSKIYSFPENLKALFFNIRGEIEETMRNFPKITRLEVIASGEKLK